MRRLQKIIQDVTQRWKETIEGKTPINVNAARTILAAYDKNKAVFEVETPKQFYIAQAVLRGRLSKAQAAEICAEIKTDASFLKHLRKIGGAQEIVAGNSWWRGTPTNILTNVMQDIVFAATKTKKNRFWGRLRRGNDDTLNRFALCHLDSLYNVFIGTAWAAGRTKSEAERARLNQLKYLIGFNGSRRVERAISTRYDAISGSAADLLAGSYNPMRHHFDGVHAEIIARAMNVKNKAATAHYEIFHHVPAFMYFRNGFLLLTATPECHLNADGLLHNETGPAITYPDDSNFWFVDGHQLTEFGEKIITAPHTLTIENIAEISNEEERRIAIDRYGWGKYLQESGGRVLDYRENWVDNTVEVLIEPGKLRDNEGGNAWRRGIEQPLRMVLACRSTGRKYFIGVPNRTSELLNMPQDTFNRAPEPAGLPKPNCELAQKWLSDGGTCEFLPYAKHSLNIVGAS